MTTEPLISITSSDFCDPNAVLHALDKHNEQYQVLEILTGKLCPVLRGKPEYLDIIGVNFYFDNQWTFPEHQFISWNESPPDPSWRSLSSLIEEVFINYGKPIVLSDTSHCEEDRAKWLNIISKECLSILKSGIPFYGCCIYPIIDRPDWDFRTFAIAADFRILQISKLWKEKFSMKAFWQYYHFLISNFKRGNPSNHYLSISGFKRSFISLISQLLNFTDRL